MKIMKTTIVKYIIKVVLILKNTETNRLELKNEICKDTPDLLFFKFLKIQGHFDKIRILLP